MKNIKYLVHLLVLVVLAVVSTNLAGKASSTMDQIFAALVFILIAYAIGVVVTEKQD